MSPTSAEGTPDTPSLDPIRLHLSSLVTPAMHSVAYSGGC